MAGVCIVQANYALCETTKKPLVCVRPTVTFDGVMFIRAVVDPNKSFTDPTNKSDVKPMGHLKTKSLI